MEEYEVISDGYKHEFYLNERSRDLIVDLSIYYDLPESKVFGESLMLYKEVCNRLEEGLYIYRVGEGEKDRKGIDEIEFPKNHDIELRLKPISGLSLVKGNIQYLVEWGEEVEEAKEYLMSLHDEYDEDPSEVVTRSMAFSEFITCLGMEGDSLVSIDEFYVDLGEVEEQGGSEVVSLSGNWL